MGMARRPFSTRIAREPVRVRPECVTAGRGAKEVRPVTMIEHRHDLAEIELLVTDRVVHPDVSLVGQWNTIPSIWNPASTWITSPVIAVV